MLRTITLQSIGYNQKDIEAATDNDTYVTNYYSNFKKV
jgi:lactate dehydrogenase-like 2-hydroxyacid dehydrogenase